MPNPTTKIDTSSISGAGTGFTLNNGLAASNLVKLDNTGKMPATDGSQLTNVDGTHFTTGTVTSTAIGDCAKLTTGTFSQSVYPNIPVSKLNSGTSASASTFWREDAKGSRVLMDLGPDHPGTGKTATQYIKYIDDQIDVVRASL